MNITDQVKPAVIPGAGAILGLLVLGPIGAVVGGVAAYYAQKKGAIKFPGK